MDERERLEQAIEAQEGLRGTLDDAIIDATIATLREKLSQLEAPRQQRKLITLLFADVVGSSKIGQYIDPEDVLEIMDGALKRMAEPVEEHYGHVTRFMGDGFKAIFGAPVAHENDAEMAVRAGLEILSVAQDYARELEETRGIRGFQVRVGVNTGLVALGGYSEAEDTVMGSSVNLAARMESAAPPGRLLITYETYKHVSGIVDVEPLQSIEVKGFDQPVPVYVVEGIKPRDSRIRRRGIEGLETSMVGRESELKLLQDAIQAAIETGEGQVVTVVGEAGVGKTRLLFEFQNWIELLPHSLHIFKGRSVQETQNIPYALLRDLFSTEFKIKESDSASTMKEKMQAGFGEVLGTDEYGQMKAHIIGQLLGYDFSESPHLKGLLEDAQQLHHRGRSYLTEYFKACADQMVCLVILEDIHWGDNSSLDLVDQLGRDTPDQPLVIVSAARDNIYERRPYWGEGETYHTRLGLRLLSRRESLQLVAEVLKNVSDVPVVLRDLVVEGGEGNPYYIEELIKMFIEVGVIIKGAEYWHVETTRLAEIDIPSTLMGVLQARLDSLPHEERTILQQASVVGRVFWDSVIEYITKSSGKGLDHEDLQGTLGALRSKEMVYRRETSDFVGSREYIFKHTMLREVTYESVLKRARRIYHGLAADWLIANCDERIGEYPGLIAGHLELAGRADQAIKYLHQAGNQAVKQYANNEAIEYFQRALALIEERSVEELISKEIVAELYENLGDVYVKIGQHDDARTTFTNALGLTPPENIFSLASLQFKLGRTWQDQGQYERASQAYGEAEKILGEEPDDGLVEWWQTWIWIQYNRLLGYYAQAKPDQIAELVAALQPVVEQYGTPQQYNAFYGSQARMYFRRDRYVVSDELLALSRKQLANALEIGEKQRIGEAHFELGLTLLLHGDLDEAEIELQRSLRIAEQCSNLYNQTLSLTYLAILSRKLDQVEDVRAYASRSFEMATKREMVDYIATAKANQAWVAWKEGDLDTAETNGKEALDMWGRVPYLYPFQWTAFWPLMAVALEKDHIGKAVECAQGMLAPEQQRLPDGIVMALESAIQSGERDQIQLTRQHLEQAVDLAKRAAYL